MKLGMQEKNRTRSKWKIKKGIPNGNAKASSFGRREIPLWPKHTIYHGNNIINILGSESPARVSAIKKPEQKPKKKLNKNKKNEPYIKYC